MKNRRNKAMIFFMSIGMMVIFTVGVAGGNKYTIRAGYTTLRLTEQVYMQNDRIYVSVRDLCEKMGIPVNWDSKKGEVHLDTFHRTVKEGVAKELKGECVIPDEETAIAVGQAILDRHREEPMWFTDVKGIKTFMNAVFWEEQNAWCIYQAFDRTNFDGIFVVEENLPFIVLSKNTGEVLHISTRPGGKLPYSKN